MRGLDRRLGLATVLVTLGVVSTTAGCAARTPGWLDPTATSSVASPGGSSRSAPSVPGVAVQQRVIVARVVDGDTLQLGDGQRVRLLGVDACETSTPQGSVATEATEAFLDGGAVELGVEPGVDRDRFGRLLRYVSVPGRGDLGAFLVGFPHTGVYRGHNDASPAYRARLEARDDGRDCG